MWSRRTSVGIGQVGLGAAFWLVESDSIALRILGVALAARGVSQFVIAYRNHPDRIAKREAKRRLPPRRDS